MKILVGMALRGHRDLNQQEIDIAIRSTNLHDVEFAHDLNDSDDFWGSDIDDCDVLLLLTSRRVSEEALGRAKRLRFVQKLGAPDQINVDAFKRRGISVSILPDPGHVAVAEHTLMFILGMARHAWRSHTAVMCGKNPLRLEPLRTTQSKRHSNWLDFPRDSFGLVADKSLGLIGFGDIAQEVAKRARCFGMNIIYTKRTRLTPELEKEAGVTFADLPTLLRNSDFVSLHVTQLGQEKHIIGIRELECMKSGAILINIAGGNQVDQKALIEFLRNGRIGGACLDVFAVEPVPADEFRGLSNVLLTPHTAGVAPLGRRFSDAIKNIEAFVNSGSVVGLR